MGGKAITLGGWVEEGEVMVIRIMGSVVSTVGAEDLGVQAAMLHLGGKKGWILKVVIKEQVGKRRR